MLLLRIVRQPRLMVAFSLLALLGACASAPVQQVEPVQPELIAELPANILSFDFQGFKFFDNAGDGYTVRYSNSRKQRLADVYIYAVAEDNQQLNHDQLVLGSTRATMQAISEAVRQGVYANFNVIGAATHTRGMRTVARVEATYLRQNLASYTLVYQSEYNGTLMKIRMSMPDNESNRANGEWDHFASQVFDLIVTDIDNGHMNADPQLQQVERQPGGPSS